MFKWLPSFRLRLIDIHQLPMHIKPNVYYIARTSLCIRFECEIENWLSTGFCLALVNVCKIESNSI